MAQAKELENDQNNNRTFHKANPSTTLVQKKVLPGPFEPLAEHYTTTARLVERSAFEQA